jgi:hypothetical protein
MVPKTHEITDRKPRADAQRNRERILEVAKQEFTRVGANASLEDIAGKWTCGYWSHRQCGAQVVFNLTSA